jgi:hypothetical protein
LKFQVLDTPIAKLWLERMNARGEYPLDDPKRFYGFSSREEEIVKAEIFLQHNIETINQYCVIISRPINIHDQDYLNYLHNIFEVYHGLLDQQHDFWKTAPDNVRQALCNLNIFAVDTKFHVYHPFS